MTQRSIAAGSAPTVIVKSHTGVKVEGWDSEQVQAETNSRWGLKMEWRSEAEFARARAAVGEHVLFDVRLKRPARQAKDVDDRVIEIQMGGEGSVRVPRGSRVKVYAGKAVQVSDIEGPVTIFTGGDVLLREIRSLGPISAGGTIDLEAEMFEGGGVKLEAGRDLRCFIRRLASATVVVNDLGGFWVGKIGSGEVTLQLKAGGDAVLVTDQTVAPQPPDFVLGQIEKPDTLSNPG